MNLLCPIRRPAALSVTVCLLDVVTHEAPARLKLVTPDAPHDFPEAERKAAYAWLDEVLK